MNSTRFRQITACVSMFASGAVTLLSVTPARTAAQIPGATYRISQRASVSQTLGNAVISLDYSRPLVRGRSDLFGKVVHWGELWTPGANEATVLEVSEEVKLNGHAVPAGRWSMWIIPSQVGPWELVLDSRDSLFHTQRPEPTDEQIRFVVEAREGAAQVEALTWAFPRIAQDGATLQMNWGATEIPITVEVEPVTPVLIVGSDTAALYVGEWDVSFTPNPMMDEPPPPTVLTVRHDSTGSLIASFPPGAFAPPEAAAADLAAEAEMTPRERERAEARRLLAVQGSESLDMVLVPRAHGVFLLGIVQNGTLLDIEEVYHEFEFEGARAVRLTIRDARDRIYATGTRRGEA